MIIKTDAKVKCDAYNCKNVATAYFAVKGMTKRCYLCSECLAKIAAENTASKPPKSPENTIKRLSAKREKEACRG